MHKWNEDQLLNHIINGWEIKDLLTTIQPITASEGWSITVNSRRHQRIKIYLFYSLTILEVKL